MSKQRISIKKVFKDIVWPRRNMLFIGLLLIVVNRLCGLVLPGASKYLIDDVVINKDYDMLKQLVGVVISAIFIQSVTSFTLTRLLSVEAQRLISHLRADVQKHILSLPISYFDNTKSGELVSRIMSDVEGVRNLVGTGLVQLIGGTITAIISLVLLINISPSMTIFVLAPISIFGVISMKAFKFIRPIFRKRGKIKAEVTGRLTESLNGVRIIKGFNAEEEENKIFQEGVDRLFKNVKKSLTTTAIMTSSSTFLLGIATTGIMGIGGYKIMQGELTIGDFLAFTLYLGFMIAPIVQMSNIGSQLTEAFAGLDRTEEIMNIPSEDADENRINRVPDIINGNITFDNVKFAYEDEKEVLHGISFEAKAGSITALVGSSGSGKTTIASLAASFLNPSSGKIHIDEQDLSTVFLNSYRKHLGVVLQDDFLFEGSIEENIRFSNASASDEALQEAVKSAYVSEFTERFEKGLGTIIGERGVKLSGGQRQRIAIARAILADPKIIILDEATSNLDTESEALIQESLAKLMKGRTTIVIAHRLSTIQQADQILVMDQGAIIERGTHDELLEKEGRYHQLYKYQARI
ncbi:ABC transporter ATP-binding protein [Flammeovirga kamogawensis]|uniref:ABC transporter ATP-binding protein/permease n=1 Tax=Flammeovirga kamogawensis TaxID=373891 RepID=A0ABX8GY16_9BACT|nr:ABC transporter ATP-binding protein [Flammeovirga kamogawensis]MBB6460957.1 subfamily B ATP-binding cassette protein MsbA [Flammeovirga kamogawensis]QWG08298.1 ABC transporter ATP-binding protein/permease [Flammeovirga kamogawensis]TRX66596.1 ABC transporter ATP-binding protein [Flammeovirga kamogawensis]